MNTTAWEHRRVLAIDPFSRGFGFILLEGPHQLVDWGVTHTRANKQGRCLARVADLMHHYEPDVIVVEDVAAKGCRRCERVQQLIGEIRRCATERRIAIRSFPRLKVKRVFTEANAHNKHEIAVAIAGRFPELASRLPPFRKPWMSEDDRMSIFDALGLALTLFHSGHRSSPAPRGPRN
jgi:Holliday junction resolvasome RuvABC endonuclease subunit